MALISLFYLYKLLFLRNFHPSKKYSYGRALDVLTIMLNIWIFAW